MVNLRSPRKVPVTISHIAEAQFYVVSEHAPGPQLSYPIS